ncbi:dual specificity protein phosphatase family protein [Pseudomonas gingeri]|uniref:phosphatase domain-containing putative toxin n=1 Tax=Pseudomonas gingeri TaxID=117681 RepID=UPI0015A04054|nr:dual specificity protein phosphatase family protein [Pseudomonas gingeri]NWD67964.1 dual specificity protein phosphatase family protein [Pseudomonas gingeri]
MQQHPYSVLPLVQLKGQLIFTPCPGTKGTRSFEALQTLKDAGAVALLTLMPTEELLQNEIDLLPEECQLLGIEWFHLPVADEQLPGEAFRAAWEQHHQRIKQLLTEGKTIAIHCKGGSGRTGLIAAQLLIECGMPFDEAIREVQSLRPRAVQHPAHIEYIGQFDIQSNSH